MKKEEILYLRSLKYLDLCDYLKNKYGNVLGNYFTSQDMSLYNKDILKEQEGLFIHHIKKNEYIGLDKKEIAKKHPFSYQEKDNLVYANILELLILHFAICKEYLTKENTLKTGNIVGLHGVIDVLCPIINDYYSGVVFNDVCLNNSLLLIKDNLEDYFDILYEWGRFVRVYDFIHMIPGIYDCNLNNPELYEASALSYTKVDNNLDIPKRYLQNQDLLLKFNQWRFYTYLPYYKFIDNNYTIEQMYEEYNKYSLNYVHVSLDDIKKYLDIDHVTGQFKYVTSDPLDDNVRLCLDLMLYYMLGDNIIYFTLWDKF